MVDKRPSEPVPVLFADNTFTFGGAINALAHLLTAIDTHRFRAIVLSAQDPTFLTASFPGIETHHWGVRLSWVHDPINQRVLRLPGFGRGPLRSIWSKVRAASWLLFNDSREALRVARFARQRNVRIVHLNNGVEGMLPPLLAAVMLRVPAVAHARGPQTTSGVNRLYSRLATHWIAVSESVAENLTASGVPRDRISVIHDAIDLSAFEAVPPRAGLREELGLPAQARVFGVFARIIPWKGIREFVQAAALVIREVPDSYALVVGDRSDGSERYYDEVVGLCQQLGLEDRVIFTGFRSDVADLMRLCDVVVHSSIVPEPFGMTVIEAMAVGRPVVAADAGGPTEIVTPGKNGLLVDPRNADELSDAVIDLLRDPVRAQVMGAHAAKHARQHYSAQRYARDVEAVYAAVGSAPRVTDGTLMPVSSE